MTSEKRPRRTPAILADARRNPGFALGAFGLSAWAYIGMSHTISDFEGEVLGWSLGVAYEALVIGLAWEGRRRADLALDGGRQVSGHKRWLGGAITVGVLSGALAAWHGWTLGEGVFAVSRAVAPVLAAVAVHLFFQSAASARDVERRASLKAQEDERQAQIKADQEGAVLDMLDAVRLAQIAPADQLDERIAAVNEAVGRVHRHVPAGVTAKVTAPHLASERTIRDVIQEAAMLAGEWMPASADRVASADQVGGADHDGATQAATSADHDASADHDGATQVASADQNDRARATRAPARRTRRTRPGRPRKLTDDDARRAYEFRAQGWTNPEIGDELGVSKDTVRRLFNEETPAHGVPMVEAPAPSVLEVDERETIQDMQEAHA